MCMYITRAYHGVCVLSNKQNKTELRKPNEIKINMFLEIQHS